MMGGLGAPPAPLRASPRMDVDKNPTFVAQDSFGKALSPFGLLHGVGVQVTHGAPFGASPRGTGAGSPHGCKRAHGCKRGQGEFI
jgi:hypothetical protein